MLYLLIVSFVWAFSFGLIKGNLVGVDASFIASARLFVALLVLLPFLRLRNINRKLALRLLIIGAFQYGIMYITYNYSFIYLKAYEVALFTIFTPIYVTLINDAFEKHLRWLNLAVALAAVIGTAIVVYNNGLPAAVLQGFLLLQISNLCFAFGQVYYKRAMSMAPKGTKDSQVFGILYLGGFLVALIPTAANVDWVTLQLTTKQILTLVYLGGVASGLCFFLWNLGGRLTNIGALAVFNNLKIPLAITVSLIFFHEAANLPNLLIGGLIVVGALLLNEWKLRQQPRKAQLRA